ncbi:MAG TPA: hypothetical protein VGK46_07235, partial [Saprospiraceae bacterium]
MINNWLFNTFFLVIILHLLVEDTAAQNYEWVSDNFPGSHVIGIEEKDGKVYAIISNGELAAYDPNIDYKVVLYEMEFIQTGEPGFILTEVNSVQYSDAFATSSVRYVDETRTWILVQAAFGNEGKQIFRVELRDENLELITTSSIDTFGYPLTCHIDTYEGKTFILGSILGPPSDELLYLVYSHTDPKYLPPIVVKQSEPRPTFWVTSMNIEDKTGEMLIFYYNGIARLDTNLHQVLRLGYDEIKTSDHGTAISTSTRYYSHGTADQVGTGGSRLNVLHMYDTSFTLLNADTFGISIPDNYPFYIKSLVLRDEKILVGGHLDGPFTHFPIYKSIKKFYLAKYDTDMTLQWYKEYGGDRAYWMAGVHLLDDGSSLAYGFVTDLIDEYRYAYILHVDENGDIISSQIDP